jgi:hypothetical protein
LTFWLLPTAKTVSVPKDKRVTARNQAAPTKLGIAHISAFSGQTDHTGYTEFPYAMGSPTVLGKIHRYRLPMLIHDGSEICVMGEEVTRELNIGWKCAD